MPIQVNSLLSSSVANDTFLDKTIDQTYPAVLTLNDGNTAQVDNLQTEVNKSTRIVNNAQTVISGEQLILNTESMNQVFRLSGNAAPVTLDNQIFSNQPIDGTEITIIGQDNTNTVQINFNDSQYGQMVNGVATLFRGYSITFIYDAGLELFIEKGRNF